MQVTLEDSFTVEAPRAVVWGLFSDPYNIVPCVRGARITQQTGERSYQGTVTMKVGPVAPSFKGNITITTLDETTGTLVLEGKGQGAKGAGSASMQLEGQLTDAGVNSTIVACKLTLSIGGKLAQFGSRLIGEVSKRVLAQFVTCFSTRVEGAMESQSA